MFIALTKQLVKAFCFMALLTFIACTPQTEEPIEDAFINPPIPELDPSYQVFKGEATEALVFKCKNGTSINIPANALCDENGKSISGEVEINYREFHDAIDIYLSGIPMGYDTAGLKQNLETAGMFDLRANQNGNPVFIKDDKTVSVRLASLESGKDYNTYFLDEEQKSWTYLENNKPEINKERRKVKQKIRELSPENPYPLNSKYFALNYEILLDVFYNNKLKNANQTHLKNKLKAYGLSWIDAASRGGVTYNGTKYPAVMIVWKKLENKPLPNWPSASANFEPMGGSKYRLTLENKEKTKQVSILVEANRTIQELFRFEPEYWETNYKEAMALVYKEQARLKTMAEVFRSAQINEFGIYNYDRLMKYEDKVEVLADFQFDNHFSSEELSQIKEVVFIPGNARSLVKLRKKDWEKLPLVKDDKACIFALMPDNKIALFSRKEYKKIDLKVLEKETSPSYSFAMKTQDEVLDSENVLRQILSLNN